MPTANMTYTTLVADLKGYSERPNDTALAAQIPRLIMLAENRLATDLKLLGQQKVVNSNFDVNSPLVAKPAYWHTTVSFSYIGADGKRVTLKLRTYEYCRNYWPDPTVYDSPRFYADYDFDHFLVVPAPPAGYAFELVYNARLDPLSDEVQTNWFTRNAPQLLLYACMLELQIYLKNSDQAGTWKGMYDELKGSSTSEDGGRTLDRNAVVK